MILPYSKCGLMRVLYSFLKDLFVICRHDLLIKPVTLLALLMQSFICLRNFNSVSNVKPRSFSVSQFLISSQTPYIGTRFQILNCVLLT